MTIKDLAEGMNKRPMPTFVVTGRFRLGEVLYAVVRSKGKIIVTNRAY